MKRSRIEARRMRTFCPLTMSGGVLNADGQLPAVRVEARRHAAADADPQPVVGRRRRNGRGRTRRRRRQRQVVPGHTVQRLRQVRCSF